MNPGNRWIIIAAFINGFLARNRSLERVYATEITKNVDMIQLTDAMINVFHTILGKLNTEKSVNNFI